MTHLYRGAPIVRSWSKYQATVTDWTLCGIDRRLASGASRERAECTEESRLVDCQHCIQLMQPSASASQQKRYPREAA